MPKDLENSKWVRAYFGIETAPSSLVELKKELVHYAELLDWNLEVDKKGWFDERGRKFFSVRVTPKGGKCSPIELAEKRAMIEGLLFSLMRDFLYKDYPPYDLERKLKSFQVKWDVYEKKDGSLVLRVLVETLVLEADLRKAIRLELENPNLAKAVFWISLKDEYLRAKEKLDKFFVDKEEKSLAEGFITALEEAGMPKFEVKRKKGIIGFLKRFQSAIP